LGSSAVTQPGSFFRESIEAAAAEGFRAVMLVGPGEAAALSRTVPANVFVAGYAPYSTVMPRCAAIVHQGGIGTTAQALRSGRPMVVVPWAYDQADNAHRAQRLGVAGFLHARDIAPATLQANCTACLRRKIRLRTVHASLRTASAPTIVFRPFVMPSRN
jgi:UDP:flavonoid glycosyltransferase YjiC (YdhE family)